MRMATTTAVVMMMMMMMRWRKRIRTKMNAIINGS